MKTCGNERMPAGGHEYSLLEEAAQRAAWLGPLSHLGNMGSDERPEGKRLEPCSYPCCLPGAVLQCSELLLPAIYRGSSVLPSHGNA